MPKKRRTTRKSSSVAAVAGRGSAAGPSSTSHTRIRKIKRYGWIPDIPDQRDYLYAAPPAFLRALPARMDLRKQCPPVYDQGQLGSCTANAVGGAIEFDQMKEKLPQIFIPRVSSSITTSASSKAPSTPTPAPCSATGSRPWPKKVPVPSQCGRILLSGSKPNRPLPATRKGPSTPR